MVICANTLINFAPLKPTQHKKVATKHAIVPWFGEGKQIGDRSGCRQLQGKTTHHYCHNTSPSWWEEKILVPVSSFFATFMSRKRAVDSSPSSKESNQVTLFHLLFNARGKSEAATRKPLHPSYTKALFLLLSSFISKQGVQDFKSRRAQGAMEAKR